MHNLDWNKDVKTNWKECHTGTKKVFSWEGVDFYAGGSSRGLVIYHNALVLNLKTATDYIFLESKSPLFKELCNKHNDIHVLNVSWPDYGVPELERSFWNDIVSIIRTLPAQGINMVIVCCVGGHGRTGTALSILYGLTAGIKDPRPIKTMRKKYCSKIVESDSQIKYIKNILGIDFKDKKREYISSNTGENWGMVWTKDEKGNWLKKPYVPMGKGEKEEKYDWKKDLPTEDKTLPATKDLYHDPFGYYDGYSWLG